MPFETSEVLILPKTPKGDFILYVLDGQQRAHASLFAAVKGLMIERFDGDKEDFATFYVDLEADSDEAIVLAELEDDAQKHRWITLHDLLFGKIKAISKYPEPAQEVIQAYKDRLNSYQFPIVTMREAPIEVATEVFTRLNVSGKDLSMFEIMVAKTYDADRKFDLAERYEALIDKLEGAPIRNSFECRCFAIGCRLHHQGNQEEGHTRHKEVSIYRRMGCCRKGIGPGHRLLAQC